MRKISDKYLHTSTSDKKLLDRVLEKRKLSGTSNIISEYEKALSRYFGIKYFVALSSGSTAIHSAFYNLGVARGDEVVIPAIAPLPSALPLLTIGAKLVFVDNQNGGFGFDSEDLQNKITRKTKAAILVPLWGYPIDYTETLRILGKHKIPVIEDCAQSHGSKWKGRHYGTFGTIGCWSTHDRKLLSTGEGGFVGTNIRKLSAKIRQFIHYGHLDNKTYGVNYKLSSLQAAVGLARIGDIERQVIIRTNNAKMIEKGLKDTPIAPFPVISRSRPNYYSLLIRLPFGEVRNRKFIQKLDERGIPSDILQYKYMPLYKRALFKRFYNGQCKNCEDTINTITSIPTHPGLTKSDIDYMITTIRKVVRKF